MRKTSQPWYFPILLLVGSMIMAGLSFTGCGGPFASHTANQCPNKQDCPSNNAIPTATISINPTQSTTIIETPVSKIPREAYIILSSSYGQDSGRIVPGGAHLHIQLVPHGKLINGQTGRTLSFNRTASKNDIGLKNIPPGTYTIQISGTDSDGAQLNLCLSYDDSEPSPRQTLALQNGLLGVEGQSATLVQLMTCPT
ncbi:MAG TPA: hypothetical protein VL485_14410 [Ktedonobacteraceae bacterium]|nr:hypothetical protein [Ktedonobacteraceae bacterium]